jgi:hypothetical protein
VVERVAGLPVGHGFNALTGEYGDMFAAGVIDPLKVTRSALQSAASIAASVNVYGTAVLLAAMARHGVARLVPASSIHPAAPVVDHAPTVGRSWASLR